VTSVFKIEPTELFPLLARAPIVEAVIEVRGRAEAIWEEHAIIERLKAKLPDYPSIVSGRAVRLTMEFAPPVAQPPAQLPIVEQAVRDMGWRGLRCDSADRRHVAQFNRDGFAFSRLAPYESWSTFQQEGLRLWQVHVELAQPAEVQRLGLRFINRIAIPAGGDLEDYLQAPPKSLREIELPFVGFLHHDTLAIPGYPYGANFIKTIQPPQGVESAGLILDIDVFTTQTVGLDQAAIEQHLAEMRWLKNKIFFGSITPKALEMFK